MPLNSKVLHHDNVTQSWHLQVGPLFFRDLNTPPSRSRRSETLYHRKQHKSFGQPYSRTYPKRSSNGQVSKKLERNYDLRFFLKNTVQNNRKTFRMFLFHQRIFIFRKLRADFVASLFYNSGNSILYF